MASSASSSSPVPPQAGDVRPDAAAQIAGLIFALVLIDADGFIAEVNHAAEALLGTSANRLIGTRLADRIGPLDTRVEARLSAGDDALVARDLADYQRIYRDEILTLPHIADIEALMTVATVQAREGLPL